MGSTFSAPLFPDCPVPGCGGITDDPRRPCAECVTAFGGYLRPAEPAMTAEEFAAELERGARRVAAVMAARREMTAHAARVRRRPPEGPPAKASEPGTVPRARRQKPSRPSAGRGTAAKQELAYLAAGEPPAASAAEGDGAQDGRLDDGGAAPGL